MSEQIRSMFAKLAPRYDATNNALSLGIHKFWRRKAVRLSGAAVGMNVLDCATGTGDLAIAFKQKVGKSGSVIGTDFCAEMLELAPDKASLKGLDVQFEIADAMNLQYLDNQFDIASISFGIRNVDSPKTCLKEMARVVNSGGKVVILELGQPRGILNVLYKIYRKTMMPLLALIVTRNDNAFHYLLDTSAAFPSREKFIEIMKETGVFSEQKFYSLTLGVAYIYIGKVK
ncbi:MAG: bifunctional demethylmenaquinone methyltransferase/2-methoxy-6-polyprenyl-1,4-benzoquinol methylase UbiE [Ignavibacteria bacterium]|nr:bifunctional demethylmenaquinone methyltransferase/2-methoxy-6-polyprenyl-1,4-benzoquinol methylase UbiE [Ignavibacteria bacterium]